MGFFNLYADLLRNQEFLLNQNITINRPYNDKEPESINLILCLKNL